MGKLGATSEPLTRAQLDHMRCGSPGCTETHDGGLAIHAACHPSSPVACWYQAGVLAFRCKRCQTLVVEIKVAP